MGGPLAIGDQRQADGGQRAEEDERHPCRQRHTPIRPWHAVHGVFERAPHRAVAFRGFLRSDEIRRNRPFIHFRMQIRLRLLVRHDDQRAFRGILENMLLLPAGRHALPMVRHDHRMRELLQHSAPRNTACRATDRHDQRQFAPLQLKLLADQPKQRVEDHDEQRQRPDDNDGQQGSVRKGFQIQYGVIDITACRDEYRTYESQNDAADCHGVSYLY